MNMDGTDMFEVISKTPELDITNKWFSVASLPTKPWYSIYPLIDRWPQVATSGVFVDVGGNIGHQAVAVKDVFPQLDCHFIVQDLNSVVSGNPHLAEKQVEFQAHDFFQPQPVKGATFYYLRHIIHDWPDREAIQILSHIREAMKPGYSKVLLNEWALPEVGVHPFIAGADAVMMAVSSAKERTLQQYAELLKQAGLEVSGVFACDDAEVQTVIEAVVPGDV